MSDKNKNEEITKKSNIFNEAKETLKMLGFKKNQIDSALTKVTSTNDIEAMIEEAIKLMSVNYESTSAQT